jgi:cytochrome c biogenesis protein CcdA/thiol-disulfide isomerase/thioredoxin
MTLYLLAWLAGLLTIASPCILPVLPFVLARADGPFRRSAVPMLLGLAFGFAAVASLASFAGGWAVGANQIGRFLALAVLSVFGLAMVWPGLAVWLTAPLVSLGARLVNHAEQRSPGRATPVSSALVGIATGLLWAPCAGPVLGLILTGAALRGPGLETFTLLLAYGLGAATALGTGMALGGRLLAMVRQAGRWTDRLRPVLGAAVLAGVASISLGLDTRFLTGLSVAPAIALESRLVARLMSAGLAPAAEAATPPALSGPLASVLQGRQWLNTPPLRAEDLRGKVVLVNFWTYSCINCLRVLPHVRTWAARYKDSGLVVIGVHTPEFAFEKDAANVAKAADMLGVSYPVVADNDFRIWRAFGNEAWPALYLIGADGRVDLRMFGEGEYDRTERAIQRLLADAHAPVAGAAPGSIQVSGTQVAPDEADLRSPETYVGYEKAENFASPDPIAGDVPKFYRPDPKLMLNSWTLSGLWTVGSEFATLDQSSGRIAFCFHARDLHLVLGPAADGRPVRFRVTIDGAAPGASHGSDTNAEGFGAVLQPRLYQLVRQDGAVHDRIFEIEFLDPGVRVYAFTFG